MLVSELLCISWVAHATAHYVRKSDNNVKNKYF